MGKIVLLVSREEMLHQAHNILQEKKFEIGEMRVIETKDTVIEARKAIAGGRDADHRQGFAGFHGQAVYGYPGSGDRDDGPGDGSAGHEGEADFKEGAPGDRGGGI